jgi:peptidyl-prolyl cis-trans isomerase SurA
MPRYLPFARSIAVSSVALALALAAASPARAQKPRPVVVLDRIVAVVNDEVITRNDLDERMKLAFAQLRRQGTPSPRATCSRSSCSTKVSSDRAIAFAEETGRAWTTPSSAWSPIASQGRLSVAQLRQTLGKEGVPFAVPRGRQ